MKQYLLLASAALLFASCSSTVNFSETKQLPKGYSAFLQMPKPGASADDPFPYKLVAIGVGDNRDCGATSYTFTGGERNTKQRVYLQYKAGSVTQPVTHLEFYPNTLKNISFSNQGISSY